MWEISNYNQTIGFLLSMCVGCVFCFLYDILRALRKVGINSFFMVAITDVLIWMFYAFVTFIFLMATTNGEIRAYVLFGELIGFVLFRASVSKLLFPILKFVFLKIYTAKLKISQFFNKVYVKFECFFSKTFKYVCKFIKRIKKGLKNAFKLLYTNKNYEAAKKG